MPARRTMAAGALASACTFAVGAQSGRPMTLHDLLVAVRVADPRLSPDGARVAYVRTTTDLASGKRNADVWTVPASGAGGAKPLIAGEKSENTPRWSPDGRVLAFISSRDGDSQVFLADADGSNIRRLTNVSGGVQPPLVFSPDGAKIAFVATSTPHSATTTATERGAKRPRKTR